MQGNFNQKGFACGAIGCVHTSKKEANECRLLQEIAREKQIQNENREKAKWEYNPLDN